MSEFMFAVPGQQFFVFFFLINLLHNRIIFLKVNFKYI